MPQAVDDLLVRPDHGAMAHFAVLHLWVGQRRWSTVTRAALESRLAGPHGRTPSLARRSMAPGVGASRRIAIPAGLALTRGGHTLERHLGWAFVDVCRFFDL